MKELKILAIVIFITALTYWGVEPFAHSQMHPHVPAENFNFLDGDTTFSQHELDISKKELESKEKALEKAKKTNNSDLIDFATKDFETAKLNLEKQQKSLEEYSEFWKEIYEIDFSKGDISRGQELLDTAGCTGCHGLEVAGMQSPTSDEEASEAFGVVPPDLSTSGFLYDEYFLAAIIKEPIMALKLSHAFNNDEKPFPMTPFGGVGENLNEELADLVAYLKSVAPKELSNEEAYKDACLRCHDIKYSNLFSPTKKENLISYMGSVPPDLSMVIRSKGHEFLNIFINDPQKQLHGTSMPRVGLDQKAQAQVIQYLEDIGDRKKTEREDLGIKIMLFFGILSIFAILWKKQVWKDLH